ncbi:phosphatase PAP2 family protein [Bacteroides pyogenes]|uniref:phosphatase PAP2 family protein n=1 Tax=Bacteroides pyogenes TaxID=310300 RepID=UPI002FDAB7A5
MNELIQNLSETDTAVFLFLNGFHNSFWDQFMSAFTGKLIWIPMYATILYVLFRNFHWKTALCYIAAIALTIGFADQMCNGVIRPLAERLRPSGEGSPIAELVHIVDGKRGGGFGFPSCHASNSFGLAFFVVCLFRRKWLSIFILLWAFTNSYTRLYLGLHYPGDLLAGALIGILGAGVFYLIASRIALNKRMPELPQREPRQTNLIIYVGLIILSGIVTYSTIAMW